MAAHAAIVEPAAICNLIISFRVRLVALAQPPMSSCYAALATTRRRQNCSRHLAINVLESGRKFHNCELGAIFRVHDLA
jgi:hypothetical protein